METQTLNPQPSTCDTIQGKQNGNAGAKRGRQSGAGWIEKERGREGENERDTCMYVCMYVCIYLSINIHIHIHKERERGRGRDRGIEEERERGREREREREKE